MVVHLYILSIPIYQVLKGLMMVLETHLSSQYAFQSLLVISICKDKHKGCFSIGVLSRCKIFVGQSWDVVNNGVKVTHFVVVIICILWFSRESSVNFLTVKFISLHVQWHL